MKHYVYCGLTGLGMVLSWIFSTSWLFKSDILYEPGSNFPVFLIMIILTVVMVFGCADLMKDKNKVTDLLLVNIVLSVLAWLSQAITATEVRIYIFIICFGFFLSSLFHLLLTLTPWSNETKPTSKP